MSKERALLERLVSWYYATGEVPPMKALVIDVEKLLSQPEEKPAVIVDAEYVAASIEFMKSQKADDAKEMVRLRDHFAGLAMQGLMASTHMGDSALHESSADWLKDITESAYEFSDAMLKERSKCNE